MPKECSKCQDGCQDGRQIIKVATVASQFMIYHYQIFPLIVNSGDLGQMRQFQFLSLVVRIKSKIVSNMAGNCNLIFIKPYQVFRNMYFRALFFLRKHKEYGIFPRKICEFENYGIGSKLVSILCKYSQMSLARFSSLAV